MHRLSPSDLVLLRSLQRRDELTSLQTGAIRRGHRRRGAPRRYVTLSLKFHVYSYDFFQDFSSDGWSDDGEVASSGLSDLMLSEPRRSSSSIDSETLHEERPAAAAVSTKKSSPLKQSVSASTLSEATGTADSFAKSWSTEVALEAKKGSSSSLKVQALQEWVIEL